MNKLFRVFFSSTFTDFVEERNALHKTVFPKLKELCASRGARFQPIDLRWGIPNEAALQQSSLQICLDEINRCQKVTPRPNYLVFLGDRYGWCPPPAKIPKSEYESISRYFSDMEKVFIESWYRLDENELFRLMDGTITTVYELQPRGETYSKYSDWEPIEKNIHSILLKTAEKTGLSENQLQKYYTSATHQEILYGALDATGSEKHVHGFIRKIKEFPEDFPLDSFLEKDPEKKIHLENVKRNLKDYLQENIHEYSVSFIDETEKKEYLESFCADVYESLEQAILSELERIENKAISALEEETQAHINFGRERTKIFIGREEILHKSRSYVESESGTPFIVLGEPGSGKSALLAKIHESLRQSSPKDYVFFLRFIGTTASSSQSVTIIRSLSEEIVSKFELDWREEIPYKYNKLLPVFHKLINSIPVGKKAILIIDALDQLSKGDKGRDLDWIPKNLPKNIALLASVAIDDTEITHLVKEKYENSTYDLKKLSPEDGKVILESLLHGNLRNLTSNQVDLVLEKFNISGSPLFMKLAFELVRHWNSYDSISHLDLASDIEGVLHNLLQRLYSNHTQKIVQRILGYIVTARNGLTEDEILDVLSKDSDPEFFQWYLSETYFELPEPKLPWIVWARLYADIKPFLTVRGVDNTSTIVLFHRQFNEFIEKMIISSFEGLFQEKLAQFFNKQSTFLSKYNYSPNLRKASECNFLLHKANLWNELELNLTDIEFIDHKCRASLLDDLLKDYTILMEKENYSRDFQKVRNFQQFILKQGHKTRIYPMYFPHYIAQQAIIQTESPFIDEVGRKYMQSFHPSLVWFDWINKEYEIDPCILTFTGHIGNVHSCQFSPDGNNILSCGSDNTLKLWNSHTGQEIRTYKGHSRDVFACKFSLDGNLILSGSKDLTLKLWDTKTGQVIQTFEGHTNSIVACTFSPDHTKVLSGSVDHTIKVWDIQTGVEILTLTGHTRTVDSVSYSPDGKLILSGSGDHSIKIWDAQTGKEIFTFLEHDGGVTSCQFTDDGRKILSSAGDKLMLLWDAQSYEIIKTFRRPGYSTNFVTISPDRTHIVTQDNSKNILLLWDMSTGKIKAKAKGHVSDTNACEYSPDGRRIVSASIDDTLKVWDVDTILNHQPEEKSNEKPGYCVFSSDGSFMLSNSNPIGLRDGNTGLILQTYQHATGSIKIALAPDDQSFLTMGFTIEHYDIKTGNKIQDIICHELAMTDIEFSPDGNTFITSSHDNTMKLWDLKTGKEIRTYSGHTDGVIFCRFTSDGKNILTVAEDTTAKLWDVNTGEVKYTISNVQSEPFSPNRAFSFSPKRDKFIVLSEDNYFRIYDTQTGNELNSFRAAAQTFATFFHDGHSLLTGTHDQFLALWNLTEGKVKMLFPTKGSPGLASIRKDGLVVVVDSLGYFYLLRIKACRKSEKE